MIPLGSKEIFLAVQRWLVVFLALIGAVFLLDPRVHVVVKHDIERMIDLFFDLRVIDGGGNLHAGFCAPRHPIARGYIELLLLSHAEAIDAGMLQIAAHDTNDFDGVGQILEAGTQAADAADNQMNRHTCLGGFD